MNRLMSTKALLFTSIICGTLSTSSCSGYTKELAPLARDLLQNGFELDELQNRALIDGVLVDAFKSGDFDSLEEIAAQFGQKNWQQQAVFQSSIGSIMLFKTFYISRPEMSQFAPK
jgi:hypothetical protein